MPLIDDDGNLFGIVNVIDVLVVVLLVAVVVAGIAVVTSSGDGSSGEPETRYATIELGEQPDYVVDRLSEGDVGTIDDSDDTATVTDLYVGRPKTNEANSSQRHVRAQLQIDGVVREDDLGRNVFTVDNRPLRLGTDLGLDMGMYATNGTVTYLGSDARPVSSDNPATNPTDTTTAEIEVENVSPVVADAIEENMSETDGNETVATIESVEREPAIVVLESQDGTIQEQEHPQNMDVTLTVELRTEETETGVYYRGDRLEIGSSLDLNFDTISIDGNVTAFD